MNSESRRARSPYEDEYTSDCEDWFANWTNSRRVQKRRQSVGDRSNNLLGSAAAAASVEIDPGTEESRSPVFPGNHVAPKKRMRENVSKTSNELKKPKLDMTKTRSIPTTTVTSRYPRSKTNFAIEKAPDAPEVYRMFDNPLEGPSGSSRTNRKKWQSAAAVPKRAEAAFDADDADFERLVRRRTTPRLVISSSDEESEFYVPPTPRAVPTFHRNRVANIDDESDCEEVDTIDRNRTTGTRVLFDTDEEESSRNRAWNPPVPLGRKKTSKNANRKVEAGPSTRDRGSNRAGRAREQQNYSIREGLEQNPEPAVATTSANPSLEAAFMSKCVLDRLPTTTGLHRSPRYNVLFDEDSDDEDTSFAPLALSPNPRRSRAPRGNGVGRRQQPRSNARDDRSASSEDFIEPQLLRRPTVNVQRLRFPSCATGRSRSTLSSQSRPLSFRRNGGEPSSSFSSHDADEIARSVTRVSPSSRSRIRSAPGRSSRVNTHTRSLGVQEGITRRVPDGITRRVPENVARRGRVRNQPPPTQQIGRGGVARRRRTSLLSPEIFTIESTDSDEELDVENSDDSGVEATCAVLDLLGGTRRFMDILYESSSSSSSDDETPTLSVHVEGPSQHPPGNSPHWRMRHVRVPNHGNRIRNRAQIVAQLEEDERIARLLQNGRSSTTRTRELLSTLADFDDEFDWDELIPNTPSRFMSLDDVRSGTALLGLPNPLWERRLRSPPLRENSPSPSVPRSMGIRQRRSPTRRSQGSTSRTAPTTPRGLVFRSPIQVLSRRRRTPTPHAPSPDEDFDYRFEFALPFGRNDANPPMRDFMEDMGLFRNRRLDMDNDYEFYVNLADRLGEVRRRGMTKGEINRLPTRIFTGVGAGVNSELVSNSSIQCHICMNDYEHNDRLRILTCFHEFHSACIDRWLKDNANCPICRVVVSLDQDIGELGGGGES